MRGRIVNRRNFFKRIVGFVCGIIGIKGLPEKEVLTTERICEIRDKLAKIEAKYSDDFYQTIKLGEPFYGKVVGMTQFQGKLFIATERDGIYAIDKA